MGYNGRPSRGCDACWSRRIKCDGELPKCSYCNISQQKCLGYRNGVNTVLREQLGKARMISERKRRLVDTSIQDRGVSRSMDLITRTSKVDIAKLSDLATICIPYPLTDGQGAPALQFFFTTYGRQLNHKYESRGFLEHVFPIYQMASSESTMQFSTLAVATFLWESWNNRMHDSKSSRGYYSKAVSAMKKQLTSDADCSNDEMLISILLLQLYESLAGTLMNSPLSLAHLDGARAIVKHRGLKTFNTKISHGLLLLMSPFNDIGQFRKTFTPGLKSDLNQNKLQTMRLETIKLDLANLQAHITSALKQSLGVQAPRMPLVLRQGLDIERRLALWYSSLPLHWHAVRLSAESSLALPSGIHAAGMYRQLCDIYPSISVAATLNKYRTTFIQNKLCLLTFHSHQPRSYTSFRAQAECLNQIQRMADDICASVPFHLGDKIEPGRMGDKSINYPWVPGKAVPEAHYEMAPAMGGWVLLESLGGLLRMLSKLRPDQKDWVRGQMMRIANIYNFGR